MSSSLLPSAERAAGSRAASRRGVLSDRRVQAAAGGSAGWLVAYAVALRLTEHSAAGQLVVQSLLYLVPIGAAAVVSGAAARRVVGWDRVFWVSMAGYCGLWLAGEVVWSTGEVVGDLPSGGTWVASGLYIGSYVPVLVAALFVGGRPHLPNGVRGLFDLAAVTGAAVYLGYEKTVVPALAEHGSQHVLFDGLYPILDSVVFIVALSIGVGARGPVPVSRLLVLASFACSGVLDSLYSSEVDVGGSNGQWLDLGWQLQACLIALAAFVAHRHLEAEGRLRTLPSRWPVIAVVALFGYVLQIIGTHVLRHRATAADVGFAGLVFLALIVRGIWANSELRHTAAGLEQARIEQERLAVTDALTGLFNRRFFEEFLAIEGERSRRYGVPLSLIVVDLDHFKWVNDEHGHPAGDAVLVGAAGRLKDAVRASDVVARYGGEEFVIVLPDTGSTAALEVADRCRRVLEETPIRLIAGRSRSGDPRITVTGSLGVATLWSFDASTVDDLLRAADRALYRAKAAGRNRVSTAGEWDFLALDEKPRESEEADPVQTALLRAAELIDADQSPAEHGPAMARWAGTLADSLGLDARTRGRCVLAARLHDIGKLSIAHSVLTKPGPLTDAEWALMRTHPEHSEALVLLSPPLAELGPIVRGHHERFDGTGYPDGLSGTAIPIEARILSVCDAWAAMRADRVYAAARPVDECRRELYAFRGRQFDPEVTDAFARLERAGLVGELAGGGPPTPGESALRTGAATR